MNEFCVGCVNFCGRLLRHQYCATCERHPGKAVCVFPLLLHPRPQNLSFARSLMLLPPVHVVATLSTPFFAPGGHASYLPGGARDVHVFRDGYREFQGLPGDTALVSTDKTTRGPFTGAANAAARGKQCLSPRWEPHRGCGHRGSVCGLARVVSSRARDLHAWSVERKFTTNCCADAGT